MECDLAQHAKAQKDDWMGWEIKESVDVKMEKESSDGCREREKEDE